MLVLPPNPEATKFLLGFFADMADRHGLTPEATTVEYRWIYQRTKRRVVISWEVPSGPRSIVYSQTRITVQLFEAKAALAPYWDQLAKPPASEMFESLHPYRALPIWAAKPADARDERGMLMMKNRVMNFFGKAKKK